MVALAQHEGSVWYVQVLVEFGAPRGLHAMVGPQNLWSVIDDDSFVGFLAGMRRCKRQMVRRMPILGEHDVIKVICKTVDQRHYLMPARYRKASSRTEIILQVDCDQHVSITDRYSRHGFNSDPSDVGRTGQPSRSKLLPPELDMSRSF